MHKTAQGMSLDEARDSLKIINGNMRKLKHNGCCIATSIHNLMDAWRAIAAADPAVPAVPDVHADPAVAAEPAADDGP
jgi:hypothetical protein